MNVLKCLLLLFFLAGNLWARPNVLFIGVDDLRDWVGHLVATRMLRLPTLIALQSVEFPLPGPIAQPLSAIPPASAC